MRKAKKVTKTALIPVRSHAARYEAAKTSARHRTPENRDESAKGREHEAKAGNVPDCVVRDAHRVRQEQEHRNT